MNIMRLNRPPLATHRTRGSALIVGLVLLLLMSVISLVSLKAIRTDERMAGNLQDQYLAFQAAEAALRRAEFLLSQPTPPSFVTTPGLYHYQDNDLPAPLDLDAGNAQIYGQTTEPLTGVCQQPRFIIEQMEAGIEEGASLVVGTRYVGDRRNAYRITALGFGGSPTTRAVLQSTFRR